MSILYVCVHDMYMCVYVCKEARRSHTYMVWCGWMGQMDESNGAEGVVGDDGVARTFA